MSAVERPAGPRHVRFAYEYNPQATEDHEEAQEDVARGRKYPRKLGRHPNYKPTALTWPFILTQMLALGVAIGLIVYAQVKMPNSDTDATISRRGLLHADVHVARAMFPNVSTPDVSSSTAQSESSSSSLSVTLPDITSTNSATSSGGAENKQVSTTDTVSITSSQPSTTDTSTSLSQSTTGSGSSSSETSTTSTSPSQSTTSSGSSISETSTTSTSSGTSSVSSSSTSSTQIGSTGSSTTTASSTTSGTVSTAPPKFSAGTISTTVTSSSLSGSLTSGTGGVEYGTIFVESSPTNSSSTPSTSFTSSTKTSGTTVLTKGMSISTGLSVSYFTTVVTSVYTTTTMVTSTFTKNITLSGSTTVYTSTIVSTKTGTTVVPVTTLSESVLTSYSEIVSSYTQSYYYSNTEGETQTDTTPASYSVLPTTVSAPYTMTVTEAVTGGSTVVTEQPVTETVPVTSVAPPTTIQSVGTTTFLSTTTASATYQSTGSVTVTYQVTVEIPQTQQQPVTEAPVRVTVESVVGGEVVTYVETHGAQTVVVATDHVETRVYSQNVQTGVTAVPGSMVTSYLTITPTPYSQGVFMNVLSTVGGTPVTVVNEQGQTVVSTIGGTPTTVAVYSAPFTGFAPVSYTVVTDVNGTPVTEVLVSTPSGQAYQVITYTAVTDINGTPVTEVLVSTANGVAYQPVTYTVKTTVGGTVTVLTITQPPQSYVTTIDGTPVTMYTTPPPTLITTTTGGTETIETYVTTPTDSGLITMTFVSSVSGTLSTFTSTFAPTTVVTTISGTPTTLTSTPSPTTSLSTRSRMTTTFISTSTPTPSPTTGNPSEPSTTVITTTKVFSWTNADVFLGTFLPAMLGVLLVIPLRIIDLNAKSYQPFQMLARNEGAVGLESMLLQYTGLMGFITPAVTLLQGHPVPFITTLSVGFASFMVPLAAEAISLKLHGTCHTAIASDHCAVALGVSPLTSNVLIAVIAFIIFLLFLLLIFLQRWKTGVYANPWNIAGIAALAGNREVRIRQISERAMKQAVAQKQYGLDYYDTPGGGEAYGLVLRDDSGRGLNDGNDSDGSSVDWLGGGMEKKSGSKFLPFMTLRYPWRCAFILFLLGLLIFIIYYHLTLTDDTRLWSFMNIHTFGVRFLFAILGVTIAFCWQAFFLSVSIMIPFQMMANKSLPAEKSILLPRPTNAFYGIYASVKQRHFFFFVTSLMAILSEFLPILLSNVPFSLTATQTSAFVCARLSIVLLGLMILAMLGSFFVRWPPMPVDPRCIAGALYYVSQSQMLDDFEGVSQMNKKERELRIKEKGKRYYFGVLIGTSWRRLGVDNDLGPSENVVTAYLGAGGQSHAHDHYHDHDRGLDEEHEQRQR